MVSRRRSGALCACLGVLVLCTAASAPGPPSGGAAAPDPAAAPAPGTDAGGAAAPAPPPPGAGPPPPAPPPWGPPPAPPAPAQPVAAQDQPPAPPTTTPTQPQVEQPPLQQEQEDPGEQEFQIDVPPEKKPKPTQAPPVPALRPLATVEPALGRLPQTGVDPRLPAALGTFLIGVGLTLLGLTLPRRV